jgi:hypothetical protein
MTPDCIGHGQKQAPWSAKAEDWFPSRLLLSAVSE